MNRGLAALVIVLTAGCAYYNGLYNANHLAREARKAEREGRTGEARSLWTQAAVKAESVSSRFPNSRYRDDALLLQGVALRRIEACPRAIPPLTIASDSSPDERIRQEARLARGQCYLELRQPDSAFASLRAIGDDADSLTRNTVHLLRGRAALALGRYDEAWTDLSQARDREAAFDRALVLVALRRIPDAIQELDAVARDTYLETPWLAILDSLSARDAAAASGLVDRLSSRDDLTRGQRARLLLGDARRLRAVDQARAEQRWDAVMQVARDSVEGRVARAHLGMIEVRKMDDLANLPAILAALREATRDGGQPLTVAGPTLATLEWIPELLTEDGDPLQLFIIAEALRDSVRATPLAALLFRSIQEKAPQSRLAPKALLAAAAIDPVRADSLVALARSAYPASPYTMMLEGRGEPAYAALEDSLRRAIIMLPTLRPVRRIQDEQPQDDNPRAESRRP